MIDECMHIDIGRGVPGKAATLSKCYIYLYIMLIRGINIICGIYKLKIYLSIGIKV